MQTNFSITQLADAAIAESERILRTCVHCGFCLATCPTYVLLGDELDSPRGRIYHIMDMLENDRPAPPSVVKHVDRCLSCLSCMTTCPSGVDYMHLVDHARVHIHKTYRRSWQDRMVRALLARVLPRPALFRAALLGAKLGRPVWRLLPGRLRTMLDMSPRSLPAPSAVDRPQTFSAEGPRRARVALLSGCAQQVLDPAINEATVRLLTRLGVEVVVARDAGCCGALVHHMGREREAQAAAARNIRSWSAELAEHGGEGLDAVIINASGCGTTIKDYGHLLAGDPALAGPALEIAGLAQDITEFVDTLGMPEIATGAGVTVAYHSACSMQHGQRIRTAPISLLRRVGFDVREVPDGHLCCGSAGTYNLLQADLAGQLRAAKLDNIRKTGARIVATGNIGCMTQLSTDELPVVHTVELLDWALGGPAPVERLASSG
ncbi:MAG: glycolate oxidase subunit GlcF [Azospirillaceae bacterium]